jgi:hypothetical protein
MTDQVMSQMKPNNRIPLLVAAAIVLVVIAGTVIQRGRDSTVVAEAQVADAAAPAAGEPAAAPPPARRAVDRAQAQGQLVDHVARRSKMREEHAARTRALREQSEQRFASEQVDPAWAPQKEGVLTGLANQSQFETAAAQPRSLDIDCRSSMCRIDGEFETGGKAEDWILMYMSSVGSEMPNAVVSRKPNPDGTMRVQIYGRAR